MKPYESTLEGPHGYVAQLGPGFLTSLCGINPSDTDTWTRVYQSLRAPPTYAMACIHRKCSCSRVAL
eukprot:1687931-Prorocentrum_lima.AAC.1